MKTINNPSLLKFYFDKHQIGSLFQNNIFDCVELFQFKKKDFIIQQGYASKYLYFLVKGEARFFTITPNGRFIPLGYSNSFRTFGEVRSLMKEDPDSSVQAVSECYCIGIEIEKYYDMLFSDPIFLKYIITTLVHNVQVQDDNISSFLNEPVQQRLSDFLLQNNEKGKITVSLKACAEATGTSYRHIIRVIEKMCDENLIRKEGRKYYINNLKTTKNH